MSRRNRRQSIDHDISHSISRTICQPLSLRRTSYVQSLGNKTEKRTLSFSATPSKVGQKMPDIFKTFSSTKQTPAFQNSDKKRKLRVRLSSIQDANPSIQLKLNNIQLNSSSRNVNVNLGSTIR